MKYVLMQPKDGGQIKIVDNSTCIGKKREERLAAEGYGSIGTIESDLSVPELKVGFMADKLVDMDKAWEARNQAIAVLQAWIF